MEPCDGPPMFVIPALMEHDEQMQLEHRLTDAGVRLTYDVKEAVIFITKATKPKRALFELRKQGLWAEVAPDAQLYHPTVDVKDGERDAKRIRLGTADPDVASTDPSSQNDVASFDAEAVAFNEALDDSATLSGSSSKIDGFAPPDSEHVYVVSKAWAEKVCEQRILLPVDNYIVINAKRVPEPLEARKSLIAPQEKTKISSIANREFLRARLSTAGNLMNSPTSHTHGVSTPTQRAAPRQSPESPDAPNPRTLIRHRHQSFDEAAHIKSTRVPALRLESTTEHDAALTASIPAPPAWVSQGLIYSCQRSTPLNGPNKAFIEQLKTIRTARILTLDEIGVRAYSTSIAAVAAYPYTLTHPREILALPGCDAKIATLFADWKNHGELEIVKRLNADEKMKVLRLFYDIWGVGAHTANAFYDKGWRDLDDIVEFGWAGLTREQQIGVKFYDEFLLKISRAEVEGIRDVVEEHMREVCKDEPGGVRTCIVGGYRRGKEESGDADIIVSHVEDKLTLGMVDELVRSLYRDKWITHNLKIHFSNSRRGQAALPYAGAPRARASFDTLDKAFIVWQDPRHDEREAKRSNGGKNPNPHRRVDIIVAPWRKIGCAVTGWTSGTTFQRDLRRYCKREKGWKFDSSGVRDQRTGREVDVQGECEDIETAERRVFEALGLEWREPWERCTS